jgi:hypothetical protein
MTPPMSGMLKYFVSNCRIERITGNLADPEGGSSSSALGSPEGASLSSTFANPEGASLSSAVAHSQGASSSSAILSVQKQVVDKGKRKLEADPHVLNPIVVAANHLSTKKRNRLYDCNRAFRGIHSTKFPWAEPLTDSNGEQTMVKCIVCSAVQGKPRIIKNKTDNLNKHEGVRKARCRLEMGNAVIEVGDTYTVPDSLHSRNEKIWISRGLNAPKPKVKPGDSREKSCKLAQFIVVLDLLMRG